ncbi:lectin [Dictyobacter formicarum]|uniref:Alpha-1,2-mannosidase n=1 Tax=Dictyobacter formicarum TaxID=2778368 RepID=A0ABQ3VAY7_9CHLR|nr:lectin [Dictyobacter formicarum]GHO83189.1 alpha-1,2-mannosidase [Dictyobacter formicarum]
MRAQRPKCTIVSIMIILTTLFTICLAVPAGNAQAAPAAAPSSSSPTQDLAHLVDPFTATGSSTNGPGGWNVGNDFPGADAPFGMVQFSPDNATAWAGGYYYGNNQIKGFSLTHLSGAGCDVYSDIPFTPYVGTVSQSPATNPSQYVSTFSHANESASAGYYQVKLDNGVNVQLTASQHSGAGLFTYPAGQTATMLVNPSGSINGDNDAEATIGKDYISGSAVSGGFCGANDTYHVYFYAQFSQPFATTGTWYNDIVTPGNTTVKGSSTVAPAVKQFEQAQAKVARGTASPADVKVASTPPLTTVSGPGSGAYVTFNTTKNTAITVKVGLSFVSVANAMQNVNQENPTGNFNTVLQQTQKDWNQKLGEIKVSGGTSTQQTTFYTSLYHTLLQPNVFSDVNGQYSGFDGQIHTAPKGHAQYANYSGWDIYRSEVQLLALLAPQQTSDIIQSMVNDYTQSGQLPKWAAANGETYVMVGDPADAIISDAYAFGARDFDTRTALAAMIKEATQTNNIRPGLNYLDSLGYEPLGGSYGCCNFYGPASTTLEYNTADFAIGSFAQALGDTANYQKFTTRAQDWENLLNPANGSLEPRNMDGSFPSPYDPTSGSGWVEGDGAQYNWMVPFNLGGLISAEGGNARFVKQLDTFFTKLNAGPNAPYAFLGNEPTIETPWEYDYAGAPYKTQQIVHNVESSLWFPGPSGMAGNDDLGTMSAWDVWASLGMFPETPGTANLVLASPLFPDITVTRPTGQTITIQAPGITDSNYYVQSLKVNGTTSTHPWLPASFVSDGGTLQYAVGSTPNTTWGSSPDDAPPSYQYGSIPTLVSLNPGRITVAPGAQAQASITAQNISNDATTVQWSATPSAGLTLTPASGSFSVAGNSNANQSFTVAAAANMAEGVYSIPLTAQTSTGVKLPISALTVVVAKPGNLLGLFNNAGISNDGQGNADFDGDGYSYSAQQLNAAGYTPGATVTVNGIQYTWPNVAVATFDNVQVAGQTIQTPDAKVGATHLTFLGSATNGPSSGNVTITYTDGSTQTAQLGFSDWTLGAGNSQPSYGNVVAVKTPYRNAGPGRDQVATYVFASAPISLNASKQVASITFPASVDQGALHVFALAVS